MLALYCLDPLSASHACVDATGLAPAEPLERLPHALDGGGIPSDRMKPCGVLQLFLLVKHTVLHSEVLFVDQASFMPSPRLQSAVCLQSNILSL